MPKAALSDLVPYLRRVCGAYGANDQTDRELLQQFLAERDNSAFAVLVRRHGPMVFGVCRRVLGDMHNAEDSFQATFMVLARRASSISWRVSVGSWLYAVALRIASKAKSQTAARRNRERRVAEMPRAEPLDEMTWEELRSMLDGEIGKLPEKYRAAIVICHFEGKSYDQAAKELQGSKSTLAKRLSRARQLLRKQLAGRGIALSVTALATALAEKAAPCAVAAMLTVNTVKAATSLATGKAIAGGVISAKAVILAEHAMKATIGISSKVIALVVVVGIAIGGAGLAGYGWQERDVEKPTKPKWETVLLQSPPKKELMQKKEVPAVDLYGDPLPAGAMARLGTTRLRHGVFISWIQFTPDGKKLVSQGGDGVSVWNTETGKQLHHFPAETKGREQMPHESTCISVDGQILVTAGKTAVYVYDLETGKRLKAIETGTVSFPRLTPDGKLLAVMRFEEPFHFEIWDFQTGKLLRKGPEAKERVATMKFTPDGKTLITSGSNNGTRTDLKIGFWDPETAMELRHIKVGSANPTTIAVSPDGKLLAGNFPDHSKGEYSIRVWDIATCAELCRMKPKAKDDRKEHTYFPTALTFSPDSQTLYSGGVDSRLIAWNPVTGEELCRIGDDFASPRAMAVSPDGKTLAAPDVGNAIRLVEVKSGEDKVPFVAHSNSVLRVLVSHDGGTVASESSRAVLVWNAKTGEHFWVGKSMYLLGLLDASKTLITQEADKKWQTQTLRVLDLLTGKEKHALSWPVVKEALVWSLAVSPNGKMAINSLPNDGGLVWFDLESGKEIALLRKPNPGESLRGAAFTADGRFLVTWNVNAGSQIQLWIWDVKERNLLKQHSFALRREPNVTAVSSDARLLAVNSSDSFGRLQLLEVYSLVTGKVLRRFDELPEGISTMAFSPDCKTLAYGTESTGRICLIEVATGGLRHTFEGHRRDVNRVAFSGDGRTLVSGGYDTSLLVWDLTNNQGNESKLASKLTTAELNVLWANLAGEHAAKAYSAIKALANAPADSIPYLGKKLAPVPHGDEKRLAVLIANLDKNTFAERQAANVELEVVGEAAIGALEKALSANLSLEATRRVQMLIEKLSSQWNSPTPDNLRFLRALEAVEMARTPQGRNLLERLASGASAARITQNAAAALERITKSSH